MLTVGPLPQRKHHITGRCIAYHAEKPYRKQYKLNKVEFSMCKTFSGTLDTSVSCWWASLLICLSSALLLFININYIIAWYTADSVLHFIDVPTADPWEL